MKGVESPHSIGASMMISISSEFGAAGGVCGWEFGVVSSSPDNSVEGIVSGEGVPSEEGLVSEEGAVSGWGSGLPPGKF